MQTKYIEYNLLRHTLKGNQYLDPTYWQQMEIVRTELTIKASLAVKLCGNFLEPIYSKDDVLLIQTQPSVEEGELGMFHVGGLAYIMVYHKDRLCSVNPDYPDIPIREEIYCRGKVIGKLNPDELLQSFGFKPTLKQEPALE